MDLYFTRFQIVNFSQKPLNFCIGVYCAMCVVSSLVIVTSLIVLVPDIIDGDFHSVKMKFACYIKDYFETKKFFN